MVKIATNDNSVTYCYNGNIHDSEIAVIQNAVSNIRNKTSKNQEFFNNLNIFVYDSWQNIPTLRNLSGITKGFTKYPFYGYDRQIFLEIGNPDYNKVSNTRMAEDLLYKELEMNTLHEIGHLFDFYFANPTPEIFNKLRTLVMQKQSNLQIDEDEFKKLFTLYKHENGLSDSEEYKTAWQSDVNREFQGYSKFKNKYKSDALGYYSPVYNHSNSNDMAKKIDLSDGLDDTEIEYADRNREEVFAQLFAYALGADSNKSNKELIIKTYRNSYEVVKKFITEYFEIEFEQEEPTKINIKA